MYNGASMPEDHVSAQKVANFFRLMHERWMNYFEGDEISVVFHGANE